MCILLFIVVSSIEWVRWCISSCCKKSIQCMILIEHSLDSHERISAQLINSKCEISFVRPENRTTLIQWIEINCIFKQRSNTLLNDISCFLFSFQLNSVVGARHWYAHRAANSNDGSVLLVHSERFRTGCSFWILLHYYSVLSFGKKKITKRKVLHLTNLHAAQSSRLNKNEVFNWNRVCFASVCCCYGNQE